MSMLWYHVEVWDFSPLESIIIGHLRNIRKIRIRSILQYIRACKYALLKEQSSTEAYRRINYSAGKNNQKLYQNGQAKINCLMQLIIFKSGFPALPAHSCSSLLKRKRPNRLLARPAGFFPLKTLPSAGNLHSYLSGKWNFKTKRIILLQSTKSNLHKTFCAKPIIQFLFFSPQLAAQFKKGRFNFSLIQATAIWCKSSLGKLEQERMNLQLRKEILS